MTNSLIGKSVIIVKNEFIDQDLLSSIVAIDESTKSLLLKLDIELVEDIKTYNYAIAKPRLSSNYLNMLLKNEFTACSVTWVPDDKYCEEAPMSLEWWRGGGSAIADLQVITLQPNQ